MNALGYSGQLRILAQIVRRDIAAKYRGAYGGYIWAVAVPLLMLAIYSFVFGSIFKPKWMPAGDDSVPFALQLFAGLLAFTIFSESVARAPNLIVSHANFVKRVVFPLGLLPCMAVISALFSALMQLIVLAGFCLIWTGHLPATALAYPLVLVPVILFSLGATYLLAALGVYIRDTGQAVGIIVTATMFLSPVFYPLAAVPDALQWLVRLSPLTASIEQSRQILFAAQWPSLAGLGYGIGAGMAVAATGFAFFNWTRKGFADVL